MWESWNEMAGFKEPFLFQYMFSCALDGLASELGSITFLYSLHSGSLIVYFLLSQQKICMSLLQWKRHVSYALMRKNIGRSLWTLLVIWRWVFWSALNLNPWTHADAYTMKSHVQGWWALFSEQSLRSFSLSKAVPPLPVSDPRRRALSCSSLNRDKAGELSLDKKLLNEAKDYFFMLFR